MNKWDNFQQKTLGVANFLCSTHCCRIIQVKSLIQNIYDGHKNH